MMLVAVKVLALTTLLILMFWKRKNNQAYYGLVTGEWLVLICSTNNWAFILVLALLVTVAIISWPKQEKRIWATAREYAKDGRLTGVKLSDGSYATYSYDDGEWTIVYHKNEEK